MSIGYRYIKKSAGKPDVSWWLTWPAIIASCFIFFPVGLFLIWKRANIELETWTYEANYYSIFGWISLGMAFIGINVGRTVEFTTYNVSLILFFIIAGVICVSSGKKMKQHQKKLEKYMYIIGNYGLLDIDRIAEAASTSYENAKKDLQEMIDKHALSGAYIDDSKRSLVVPGASQETVHNQPNNSEEKNKMQVVTCKGCGSQNTIKTGTVDECEYCGSKIEV